MTTTILDRVVHWNLDLDGDLYGDERERFRWYEGIATAASLQWIAIPWAAAILVWIVGKPSVLPLAVVLLVLFVPMVLCTAYVRAKRVETAPRSWRPKRIVLAILGVVPFVVFVVGALYVYEPHGSTWQGAAFGGLFGGLVGVAATVVEGRRRRRREAALVGDED